MGVSGLWELLSPIGHRVSNEHVRNKVLAVDVSVWLTQFVKAMRDSEGAQLRNGHLLGVLRRCVKLLFLSVRPVLIFDGATPALKRKTLALRRSSRANHAAKLRRLAEKLLMNQMKQSALSFALPGRLHAKKLKKASPEPQTVLDLTGDEDSSVVEPNGEDIKRLFKGNDPMANVDRDTSGAGHVNLSDYTLDPIPTTGDVARGKDVEVAPGDIAVPDDLDEIDDDALINLPGSMQSDIFKQIKLRQRQKHREDMMLHSNTPESFSKTQIDGFLRNTALNRRISKVRNVISVNSGATQRIASDSTRMYILKEKKPSKKLEDYRLDDSDSDDDILQPPAVAAESPSFCGIEPSPASGGGSIAQKKVDLLAQIRLEKQRESSQSTGKKPSHSKDTGTGKSSVGWASSVLQNGGGHRLGDDRTEKDFERKGFLRSEMDEANDCSDLEVASDLEIALKTPSRRKVNPENIEQTSGTGSSDSEDIEWEDDTPKEAEVPDVSKVMSNVPSKDSPSRDGEIASGAGDESDQPIGSPLPGVRPGSPKLTDERKPPIIPDESVFILPSFSSLKKKPPTDTISKADEVGGERSRRKPSVGLVDLDDDIYLDASAHQTTQTAFDDAGHAVPKRRALVDLDDDIPMYSSPQDVHDKDSESQAHSKMGCKSPQLKKRRRLVDLDDDYEVGGSHRDNPESQMNKGRTSSELGPSTSGTFSLQTQLKSIGELETSARPKRSTEKEAFSPEQDGRETTDLQTAIALSLEEMRDGAISVCDRSANDIQKPQDEEVRAKTGALPIDVFEMESPNAGSKYLNAPGKETPRELTTVLPNKDQAGDMGLRQHGPAHAEEYDKHQRPSSGEAEESPLVPCEQVPNTMSKGPGATNVLSSLDDRRHLTDDKSDLGQKDSNLHTSKTLKEEDVEQSRKKGPINKVDSPKVKESTRVQLTFANKDQMPPPETNEFYLPDATTGHIDTSGVAPMKIRSETNREAPTSTNYKDVDEDIISPALKENELGENIREEKLKQLQEELANEEKQLKRKKQSHQAELGENIPEEQLKQLKDELANEEKQLRRKKRSHQAGVDSVSDEMYSETRDLLKLLGIPYLEAPTEAEAQCAFLNKEKVVDGVITEDSDSFLFGALTVYRHLFSEGRFAEAFEAQDIQIGLGLSREDLIRLAFLLGSDYTSGVRGVGVVNAMEILEAFPDEGRGLDGLHGFREWTQKITVLDEQPPEEVLSGTSQEAVRRRFCWKHRNMKRNWEIRDGFPNPHVFKAYMSPDINKDKTKFKWGKVNFTALEQFCWEKFGWEHAVFENFAGPLKRELKSHQGAQYQRRIDEFFKPHRFAKIRSERLQNAVEGIAGEGAKELKAEFPPRLPKRKTKSSVKKDDAPDIDDDQLVEMLEVTESQLGLNEPEKTAAPKKPRS